MYTNEADEVGTDITSLDLRLILNNVQVGCMSSCKKLNYGVIPYGLNQSEGCFPTLDYCCPTDFAIDPECNGQQSSYCQDNRIYNSSSSTSGCITAPACSAGPVATSDYVKFIHEKAPGIYAYAYDDGQGLYQCLDRNDIYYEIVFGGQNSNIIQKWKNKFDSVSKI